MAQRPLIWQTYEYSYRHKTADWYWTVWIVVISLGAISVIYGNIMLAGVLIVGTFALSVFASRAPQLLRYEINEKGIVIGNTMYPYSTLDSFGIDIYAPEMPKLVIKSKKKMMAFIIIPLDTINEEVVRKYLAYYLVEAEHEEPLTQKIMEYLGF
ncbi:MAG: hypothetical protein PHS53_01790 [Candidatus Pacebacteria bacterium]|nr:hypothetical protein [Candidatus Paceibacterota bacterium]MDD5356860.1 hypothetical protein [Candidatus Paceibacterota bacterium]